MANELKDNVIKTNSAMAVSERSQKIILLWAFAFMLIFLLAWVFLLQMIPPPPATLTAADVAAYYTEHAFKIKVGSVLASYTSACMVPFSLVIAFQLARLEEGKPIWSVLSFAGGCLMSMFLVFPPLLWGIAAFEPSRPAEITSALNQMANLTLVTTDQFYIFQMIAITYVGLTTKTQHNTAFPRWVCWVNLWVALIFEVGAPSFLFHRGPFAWNGLFVFWIPFFGFFVWQLILYYCMWSALSKQEHDFETHQK